MRSLTSSPDSGEAIALATDAMSECSDKLKSSKPGRRKTSVWFEQKRRRESEGQKGGKEKINTSTIPRGTGNTHSEKLLEVLTFCLGNGGGGGDGAERGAAGKGGVGPGHGHGVTHPGCWVNGSDRLICTQRRKRRRWRRRRSLIVFVCWANKSQRTTGSCTDFEEE